MTRHPPPVEAALQLGAGIEGTAVQGHDALPLQLREGLGTVLQLGRHGAQGVVHPGGHLHNNNTTWSQLDRGSRGLRIGVTNQLVMHSSPIIIIIVTKVI